MKESKGKVINKNRKAKMCKFLIGLIALKKFFFDRHDILFFFQQCL